MNSAVKLIIPSVTPKKIGTGHGIIISIPYKGRQLLEDEKVDILSKIKTTFLNKRKVTFGGYIARWAL